MKMLTMIELISQSINVLLIPLQIFTTYVVKRVPKNDPRGKRDDINPM
jgi:hypothetical protein